MITQDSTLKIDCHHHYNPLNVNNIPQRIRNKINASFDDWDICNHLDMMDRNNISKSILSYPAYHSILSGEEQSNLCKRINENFAKLSYNNNRLGAFATLPIYKKDRLVLSEVEYALDTLKLDGIALPTQVLNGCFDNHELYEELDRRNANVFIHPYISLVEGEENMKTHRIITQVDHAGFYLVFKDIISKFPHIRFVLSYGGGNIPFYFSQIKYEILEFHDKPYRIENKLRRFYFDTAFPSNETTMMDCLCDFVNSSQILFGSNYPYQAQQYTKQKAKRKLYLFSKIY